MTIGWHRFQERNLDGPAEPGASRGRATLTAIGTWPVGLSYGTVSRSWATADDGELRVQSLRVSHFGVTILQTLIEDVVVGTTVKVLRGSVVRGDVGASTASAAFDALDDAPRDAAFDIDLDAGLLAGSSTVRFALVVKNLRSPDFGESAEAAAVRLPRQARAGISVRPFSGLTLAIDVDLNTVDLMDGRRRMAAAGGELAIGGAVQVRSGVRWNRAGAEGPVAAVGGSLALRRGFWLDGHYSRGRTDDSKEIGLALRAGF
jgi:hypothetical protein